MGERIEKAPDTSDDRLVELIRWTGEMGMPDVHALLLDLQKRRAAQAASAEHAAMLLLDGLSGRRSANVFEAARNVEAAIAGIPGRPVAQEPSARGRDLHDAAVLLVEAFMDGAAYVHDHSEVDDGRIVLERGASVEHAAAQHVRDHEGASKTTQVSATAGEGTDHQPADADRVRAVVREAASDHLGPDVEGWGKVADAIADRVAAQLTAPPALSPDDRAILLRLRAAEAATKASIGRGHLEDVRRLCADAIALFDRLLGGAP